MGCGAEFWKSNSRLFEGLLYFEAKAVRALHYFMLNMKVLGPFRIKWPADPRTRLHVPGDFSILIPFLMLAIFPGRCSMNQKIKIVRSTGLIYLNTVYELTLVDFQLDAQNSYLFTYNTFIKILYTFRALPCSSSGGLRRNCIYAAYGIVTVCR